MLYGFSLKDLQKEVYIFLKLGSIAWQEKNKFRQKKEQ